MGDWWQREIVEPGKLPLLLCLAAFVITFLTTRFITRSIRAGRGPFRDNVQGGLHIHHAVPGLILLVVGAVMAVRLNTDDSPWIEIAGILVGVGTSLVLDEFALILRLQDVYWSDEGRVSVELIALAAACLGFVLIGVNPFGTTADVDVGLDLAGVRITVATGVVLNAAAVVVCIVKGKYRVALLGCFVPLVAWICACRLARPRSWWARRFYGPKRLARATQRARTFDARWDPRWRWLSDSIAGRPTGDEAPGAPPLPSDPVTDDDVAAAEPRSGG